MNKAKNNARNTKTSSAKCNAKNNARNTSSSARNSENCK